MFVTQNDKKGISRRTPFTFLLLHYHQTVSNIKQINVLSAASSHIFETSPNIFEKPTLYKSLTTSRYPLQTFFRQTFYNRQLLMFSWENGIQSKVKCSL